MDYIVIFKKDASMKKQYKKEVVIPFEVEDVLRIVMLFIPCVTLQILYRKEPVIKILKF